MKRAGERRENEMPLAMKTKVRLTLIVVIGAAVLSAKLSSDGRLSRAARPAAPSLPAAAALPLSAREAAATEQAVRFLSDRVRRDPDDHAAQNRLAGYYLRRAGETGDPDNLALAFRAARASLRSVGAERNTGGLAVLAQAELMSHAFTEARDHALQLTRLTPARSTPYQILGDALLELGEYDKAATAFRQMARRDGGGINTETRRARLAALHGETGAARRHLANAVAFALDLPAPPRETVAWCLWQRGETDFAEGDYLAAERHCRDALATFPGYAPALASLGRVRAARGDLADAVTHYEHAVRLRPDELVFAAGLGDLYRLAGRERDAQKQYARVERIGRENGGSNARFGRELALFYADHDLNAQEAYANALREYEQRRDIYGADIVAWTALKAGKVAEAQNAMKAALRLGTRDARLLYHVGLIARATGDEDAARDYLRRALFLNPRFDPLQAPIARKALGLTLRPRSHSASRGRGPRG